MASPEAFAATLVDFLVQGTLVGAFFLALVLILPVRGS
jgi:Na+-translocating ferredoxin:NAD+ oxidoreductase RnfD subunit